MLMSLYRGSQSSGSAKSGWNAAAARVTSLRTARASRARSARMNDLFDNPMGLMGFEFVEFASPEPNVIEPTLQRLGFTEVARHRSKDVVLYRQGEINFIVNREPKSAAWYFAAEH